MLNKCQLCGLMGLSSLSSCIIYILFSLQGTAKENPNSSWLIQYCAKEDRKKKKKREYWKHRESQANCSPDGRAQAQCSTSSLYPQVTFTPPLPSPHSPSAPSALPRLDLSPLGQLLPRNPLGIPNPPERLSVCIPSTCCSGFSNPSMGAQGHQTCGPKQLLSFLTCPKAGLLSRTHPNAFVLAHESPVTDSATVP